MPGVLGSYQIPQTEALGKVKGDVLEEQRGMAVNAIYKFLNQEGVSESLAGKLENTQLPVEAEIGRNAAQMAERAYQQAKEQGLDLPQSAIWTVPRDDGAPEGAVPAAIEAQIKIANTIGVLRDREDSEIAEKSLMFAVKEGMRAPGIAEGASALAEMFSQGGGGAPVEAMQGVNSLLGSVSAGAGTGSEVEPPTSGGV